MQDDTYPGIDELTTVYRQQRQRVDAAMQRMVEITAPLRPHAPAEARATASELTEELRRATTTVSRILHLLQPQPPPPRRLRRRRKASRSVPADYAAWSAELVRLTEIGEWLRFTTLDYPGIHVPATVEVVGLAATGPDVAGLTTERADLVTSGSTETRVGVDLRAVVDAHDGALSGVAVLPAAEVAAAMAA